MIMNQFDVAIHGAGAIKAFAYAGGKFTNEQNELGCTAAMFVAFNGADAIEAFVKAGGKFTDQKDNAGKTAAMYAAMGARGSKRAYDDAVAAQKEAEAAQQEVGVTGERPAPKAPDKSNAPGPA